MPDITKEAIAKASVHLFIIGLFTGLKISKRRYCWYG